MIDINELTIGQAKELSGLFSTRVEQNNPESLNQMIGNSVIIRTYSAGCWFGTLSKKSGNEVIITDARRMYYWAAKESISLSACAKYGIDNDKSKIVESIESVWLEAIEIMPCTNVAEASLSGADNVKAS